MLATEDTKAHDAGNRGRERGEDRGREMAMTEREREGRWWCDGDDRKQLGRQKGMREGA
jgi:hypothetical protein